MNFELVRCPNCGSTYVARLRLIVEHVIERDNTIESTDAPVWTDDFECQTCDHEWTEDA